MSRGGRVEREQVMDEAVVQALHTRCDVLARELDDQRRLIYERAMEQHAETPARLRVLEERTLDALRRCEALATRLKDVEAEAKKRERDQAVLEGLIQLTSRLDLTVSRMQQREKHAQDDAKKSAEIEAYVRRFTPPAPDPRAWKLDEKGDPETFPWSCSACGGVHWYKPSETVDSSKELAQACKDAMKTGTQNGAHEWWVALAKQVRRGVHDEIKLQLQAVIPSLKKD